MSVECQSEELGEVHGAPMESLLGAMGAQGGGQARGNLGIPFIRKMGNGSMMLDVSNQPVTRLRSVSSVSETKECIALEDQGEVWRCVEHVTDLKTSALGTTSTSIRLGTLNIDV